MTVPGAAAVRAGAGAAASASLLPLLERWAAYTPAADAFRVTGEERATSYATLWAAVQRLRADFAGRGLTAGDAVGVIATNQPETILGVLALLDLGVAAAPLHPSLTREQVATALTNIGARALVMPAAQNALPWRSGVPSWSVLWPRHAGTSLPELIAPADAAGTLSRPRLPEGTALLLLTAGTTGAPKIVPLTHRNLLASLRAFVRTYRLGPDDTTLAVMPFGHGHGLIGTLLSALFSGGTVALPGEGRFSAHRFWPELSDARATWLTATPSLLRIALLHAPVHLAAPLRFVRTCSEHLDPHLAAELHRSFAAPVIPAYGMTEAAHHVASNPLPTDGEVELETVGRSRDLTIRIIRPDGTTADPAERGEIVLSGEAIAARYLHAPLPRTQDGAFLTGDVGFIDPEGYLVVQGRQDDVINRGGEKISPEAVEQALRTLRGVSAAAVFGVDDPVYGQRVEAAVTVDVTPPPSETDLRTRLQPLISTAELPAAVHILDRLPTTLKGTADRAALSRRFGGARGERL